jgi:hypothetical protein
MGGAKGRCIWRAGNVAITKTNTKASSSQIIFFIYFAHFPNKKKTNAK